MLALCDSGFIRLGPLALVVVALIDILSRLLSTSLCLLAHEVQVGAWREEKPLPTQCHYCHCEPHME